MEITNPWCLLLIANPLVVRGAALESYAERGGGGGGGGEGEGEGGREGGASGSDL
jgi:hypothetical protein